MTPPIVMVVAGDPSGDANAADLVRNLAEALPGAQFIGAGGPKMAEAGVQLSFNLIDDSAIGPTDAAKNLGSFWEKRRRLYELALERRPALIILVDAYTFNQPLARAVKNFVRASAPDWQPKVVRYTSPQVWASRPGRAEKMAKDIDLLLCFFPFEKEWYERRGTGMRVECVGHPMFDRLGPPAGADRVETEPPTIMLLPGSRADEVRRHLPIMLAAARAISSARPARFKVVAVNEKMAEAMRPGLAAGLPAAEIHTGQIAGALSTATLAITKTGTITMECAYFGVPAVTLYKASPLFYALARPFVTVKYLSMPNLLAGEAVFPEFVQSEATPENLARAALELLSNAAQREAVRAKLRSIIKSLGGPGAAKRATALIAPILATP